MTAIDLRILFFVTPPHLKPRVWLAMKPIHLGYVPWTDFLAWPHPDPVNTLRLSLTLFAFPRPGPCPHSWADGPARLSCLPPSPPCSLTGAVGQALAGHAMPCPASPGSPCSSQFPGMPGSSQHTCAWAWQNYLPSKPSPRIRSVVEIKAETKVWVLSCLSLHICSFLCDIMQVHIVILTFSSCS